MKNDYLVILSPGESWQSLYLVMDAPTRYAAEDAVWNERGYNSGEPVTIRPVSDRAAVTKSAEYVITYQPLTESQREAIRYND